MLTEHIYLMFACWKVGVIICPLDLRLKAQEIIKSVELIKPKVHFIHYFEKIVKIPLH